jgi:hypothetical protein
MKSTHVVFVCLIGLTRCLVLPRDMFSKSDVETLFAFTTEAFRGSGQEGAYTRSELKKWLCESDGGEDLLTLPLRLLREIGSSETELLLNGLLQYAAQLAGDTANGLGLRVAAHEHVVKLLTEAARGEAPDHAAESATSGSLIAYGVLGVTSLCSDEDLRIAYRQQVKDWHPDRMQALPLELQALAGKKLQEINTAYEDLLAVRRPFDVSQSAE